MKPLILIMLAFVGVSACGDDDERSGYRTGVRDDTATVSTLGDADKQKICRSLDAHLNVTINFEEAARLACLPPSILLSSSREDCETRLAACVANAPAPLRVRADAMNQQVCYDSLAQCNASVGDIEGCVDVSLDAALDFLERVSCARYSDANVRSTATTMQSARSCAEISATCDDFGPLLL
jgi:hypothetical protein